MKKIICIFVCLVMISGFVPVGFCEEVPWTDQFLKEFKEIKARIAALEKQQDEILVKQNTILEEVNRARIQARR